MGANGEQGSGSSRNRVLLQAIRAASSSVPSASERHHVLIAAAALGVVTAGGTAQV